jgi:phosphatidate cytidylyltransferase
MIRTIYIIILAYFLAGSVGFYFIGRKKNPIEANKNRIKLITYFIIINILFFSIVINDVFFRYLAIIIIAAGLFEMFKLFRESGYRLKKLFWFSLFIYGIFSCGFIYFCSLEKGLVLFSFLILSIFDSFSQITGQLWGKKKLVQKISPSKTFEGLAGGALIALLSSLLIRGLIEAKPAEAISMASGVVVFAFIGDVSASFYKRKYNVKDFSNIIPGHGGFLDRFDSLIAGSAWVAFSGYLLRLLKLF